MTEQKKQRNDPKKKIQTKVKGKKKKKKNRNRNQLLNQCPHCSHWFSLSNDVYNIHLTQCKIVQESIAINIDQQESSSPNCPTRTERFRLSFDDCINRNRYDIKHCYGGGTNNTNVTNECAGIGIKNKKSEGRDVNVEPSTEVSEMVDSHGSEDLYQLHEKAWSLFETTAKSALRSKVNIEFCHIPFPPDSLDSDSLYDLFGLSSETPLYLKRARMRKLLIRW